MVQQYLVLAVASTTERNKGELDYSSANSANPPVNVIVLAHNVELWSNLCTESLSRQANCDLEIIFVDDGSTDATPVMCDVWIRRDGKAISFISPTMVYWMSGMSDPMHAEEVHLYCG
ncbi:glycosyltransferase family 2 protein [Bifidobacterium oedipodis]|uniref:glycosyltransferase n=1 Tax=Bifidobacterium oedipodis TaxID=2675322 RepID=UPI00145DCDF9